MNEILKVSFGVVKIGGATGNDPTSLLEELVARVKQGERWVLVHGASGPMEAMCRSCDIEPLYVTSPSGYRSRFVGAKELALFEAACCRYSVELSWTLGRYGLASLPIYPSQAVTAKATRKDALRSLENGRVRVLRGNYSGTVCGFEPAPLYEAWDRGLLPMLPPLASDEQGNSLNVDGDRMAAAAAAAIGADTLIILSNVPGILRNVEDPQSRVESADFEMWNELESLAQGNMKRKLLAAREALEGNVGRVILADSRRDAPVTRALAGGGTTLCRTFTAAAV
ncbi:MAG: [LysW]-aminoadipate kinase [Synergistaceae bacterium]|jgi:acetylglutamate/LysW-gamma-L-alpha-aminoadipate kinase|nr:[LysW]-aminoadipate kinase [Synergistaceae bacterium]